jgi:hypothetical protein
MSLFTELNVFFGSERKNGIAACPVKTSPVLAKCITDGIVRLVSPVCAFITTGTISVAPDSVTMATALFVVPKSMPQMSSVVLRIARTPLRLLIVEEVFARVFFVVRLMRAREEDADEKSLQNCRRVVVFGAM